ncbi:putative GPI anchor biosynthesis protein Gwt1 [Aspergillus homomorphus CBS 101889]|uniref:GPI-anchored wall transfer protein n=1 Tax=Aspergillus homomorphus (strain CBS 101889) TaxID=1450537 RepID=A0A395I9I6_ASPHC|nr:GPI-anchored wall transfer protein 1 [Aspergillus homomorphus CBS 101889]RAL16686.1 GPI-anchored wall transfer protein 1 [Aspergillus homomorphus CBS 101889]
MDPSYKARKEAFVSNLAGGSILEIYAVTLVAPAAVLLWSALQSRLSFFSPYNPAALVTDFLLNVLAILFATTVYSVAPWTLNALLVAPALLLLLLKNSRPQRPQRTQQRAKPSPKASLSRKNDSESDQSLPILPFLTTYRSCMMVITCVAILAVDFRVFPRRFAKVENWGTSLMDLGVGSFVFSGGVVSARSVLKGRQNGGAKKPLGQRLVASTRHSIRLLLLGLVRLYTVKGLDYAEHVTEYGVHWNFFFTLGFLPPFAEIFDTIAALIPSYELLSLGVAALYQVALESTELKSYILVAPRGPDLLSRNREGVFSFVGYFAIFLAGRAIGIRIMSRGASPSTTPQQARRRVLVTLGGQALLWTAVFLLNSTYALGFGANIPVSRRLANMPYVVWVSAFNNAQLFLFCLLETVFFPQVHRTSGREGEAERVSFATSPILSAFNKDGLGIFLLANLLTGLVNLSVPTLDVNTVQAMAILIAYAAVLTGIALGMDRLGLKLAI